MTEHHIPLTMDEAVHALEGIGQLLRAKGWEKAAIVWAFVDPGQGQGARKDLTSDEFIGCQAGKISASEFATYGITGLRNHQQVLKYHANWQYAIDAGEARPVAPGDTFDIPPTLTWPPVEEQWTPTAGLGRRATFEQQVAAIDRVMHNAREADDADERVSALVEHAMRGGAEDDDDPVALDGQMRAAATTLAHPLVQAKLRHQPEDAAGLGAAVVSVASGSPRLAAQTRAAFNERNPAPEPPTSAAAAIPALLCGTAVLVAVRAAGYDVARLIEVLSHPSRTASTTAAVEANRDRFHAAADLCASYAHRLDAALLGFEPLPALEDKWDDLLKEVH